MAGMAKKVQLFYDVISPYSWVGFEILCRYRSRWNIELKFCPFFLSGIMQQTGNKPPGMVPAKGVYMSTDISRLRHFYQIPMHQPSDTADVIFRKGSLSAQRFLTAADTLCPNKVEEISRQLWVRIWSQDKDITEENSLREAGESAGLTREVVDQLIGMIKSEAVKEKLKKTTQEALDLGCFGSPFIVVNMKDGSKETFFGTDRMEVMASIIGEKWEGPLTELKARL